MDPNMSEQKSEALVTPRMEIDLEHISGKAGTLVVAPGFGDHPKEHLGEETISHLKTTADGKFILIPQPPDDPEHVLNWSWRKKHLILFVLFYSTLMTDMTSAWPIPLVIAQSEYWGISTTNAGRNISGNVFMIGAGGLAAVPLTRWLGRLPILFWAISIALILTIAASATPGWMSYLVIRCIQGFVITAPQVVGLSMIHDMFFFHEHARKIGIWAFSIIFSPVIGPLISGVIVNYASWRTSSWVNTGLLAIGVILIVLFGEETAHGDGKTPVSSSKSSKMTERLLSRVKLLTGVTGYRAYHNGVKHTIQDMCIVATRPHFVCVCVYYLLSFMWSIGINVTLTLFFVPPPPVGYGYSTLTVSLFYFSPIIGMFLGELFGHWFNDFIFSRHIRRSRGVYEPEVRLWMVWISVVLLIGSLVLYGYALADKLPWIGPVMAYGIYGFGLVTQTVAITAYASDVFPDHTVEASSIINAFRVFGGFIVNYFLVDWAEGSGPVVSFGIQAGIVGGAFLLILTVQVFGSRWRGAFPSPKKQT
ncbi:hypothetical protein RBB50_008329 [Rhinocladiella similis]